jgi:ABC-type uncharacterized transport system auxiliary subunit
MIYRKKPFVVDTYRYHRWQAEPKQLVVWQLLRDLTAAGFLSTVLTADSRVPATHVLEGSVLAFFQDEAPGGWEAAVTVAVTLTRRNYATREHPVLLQKTFEARESCRLNHPEALAEAMSRAMQRISAEMAADIHRTLGGVDR